MSDENIEAGLGGIDLGGTVIVEPVSDPDQNFDTAVASTVIQTEIDKTSAIVTKPATKTTSFYFTIATFLAGAIATWLVGKGYITIGQHDSATTALQGIILFVMGWAVVTFMKTRGEVAKIKAIAAATKELHTLGIGSPFGGSN